MFSKLTFLFISGLFIRNAHSEYDPMTMFDIGELDETGFRRQRLSSVDTLTLYKDRETIGFKPIKQLSCLDDQNLCDEYAPSIVTCNNKGSFNGNTKWDCEPNLENVELANQEVNCEMAPGFGQPYYIIEGSCGLSYTLIIGSSFDRPLTTVLICIAVIGCVIVQVFAFIKFCPRCKDCENTGATSDIISHDNQLHTTLHMNTYNNYNCGGNNFSSGYAPTTFR